MADKTVLYAPVPEPKTGKDAKKEDDKGLAQSDGVRQDNALRQNKDKYQPKPSNSQAVADWRQRMVGSQAQGLYKQRAATAECVNAQAHNRGLWRMPVPGLAKVRSVVGLFVLAHNLMRMAALAPQIID